MYHCASTGIIILIVHILLAAVSVFLLIKYSWITSLVDRHFDSRPFRNAGCCSRLASLPHKQKVAGSSPAPATIKPFTSLTYGRDDLWWRSSIGKNTGLSIQRLRVRRPPSSFNFEIERSHI